MRCGDYNFYINRSILSFLLGALLPLFVAVVEVPLIAKRHHALILRPGIGSYGNSLKYYKLLKYQAYSNYFKSTATGDNTYGL
jgi:hypothetical protein